MDLVCVVKRDTLVSAVQPRGDTVLPLDIFQVDYIAEFDRDKAGQIAVVLDRRSAIASQSVALFPSHAVVDAAVRVVALGSRLV